MDRVRRFGSFLVNDGKGITLLLLILLAISMGLLYGSEAMSQSHPQLSKAAYAAAGILLGSGFASLLSRTMWWKEAVKTVMRDLAKDFEGRLSAVLTLGLEEVVWFGDSVPWEKWLREANTFEVFAIRASTLFTGDSRAKVQDYLSRNDTELTVVFADPNDSQLMEFYDSAFEEKSGTRKRKIEESIRHAKEIARNAGASDRLTIRFAKKPFHFALYRFNGDRILYTPTWSKPGKDPGRVPGFLFGSGEMSDKVLHTEADFLVSDDGSTLYSDTSTDAP